LCLGITFNHLTGIDEDLAGNVFEFKDWPMTYALGIVARMAAGVFGESLSDIYRGLTKPAVRKALCKLGGLADARDVVVSCVEYLLERTQKTAIFLALDEALAAEEALLDSFQPSPKLEAGWKANARRNYDAMQIVRKALLDSPAIPRGALLVSSLEQIRPTGDSTRKIVPLPVPAHLDPADVLSQWWFVDCSLADSSYNDLTLSLTELRARRPRQTIYKAADPVSMQRLLRLAALSISLPRGLEYMKEQLDEEMKSVPADADGLKPIDLKKDMADRIWQFARTEFAERPTLSEVEELPSPSVVCDWLFDRPVPLPSVSHLIRRSLFTNSVVGKQVLHLESCVFSWSAIELIGSGAFGVVLERIKSLVNTLQDVCGSAYQTQQHFGEPVQEGTPLEVAAMHMLQIRLAALVADSARERYISIESLFYPRWSEVARVETLLADTNVVFGALVSLPATESMHFSVKEMLLTRLNKNPVQFFQELNAIDLTERRFQILRGAAGDCFDVGLLFIDAKTDNVCLWLGDMKSAAEHRVPPEVTLATLPDTFNSGKKEVAVKTGLDKIRASLAKKGHQKQQKSVRQKRTGEEGEAGEVKVEEKMEKHGLITASGRALTEGRVLLSFLSTQPGPGKFTAGNSTRCDVAVVGRNVVRAFLTEAFFPYYALFRSVAAPTAKQVRGEVADGKQ
jgi:hypothetical protein